MLSEEIKFASSHYNQLQKHLEAYLASLASPFESFFEQHLLNSQFFEIHVDDILIGSFAVYHSELLTYFFIDKAYRHYSQTAFTKVLTEPNIERLFIFTGDEHSTSLALECDWSFEMQAYFFQDREEGPSDIDAQFELAQATEGDIDFIRSHSRDFYDPIARRIKSKELYIGRYAGEPVSIGIIEASSLIPYNASVGMFVLNAKRRQGFGTQTIRALKNLCYQMAITPLAGCWYHNYHSKSTLEKAGMFTQTRLLKFKNRQD